MAVDTDKSVQRWIAELTVRLERDPVDLTSCRDALGALTSQVEQLLADRHRPIRLAPRLWSEGFLTQAKDDLSAAEALAATGSAPASVLAMLLQMVFEKLAKAALARADAAAFDANRTKHVAASRLVRVIKNQARFTELRHSWKDILPMVQALERAHPSVAQGGPHLEYPWEAGDELRLPDTLAIVRTLGDPRDPQGPRLLRFARELADRFDDLFP